MSLIYFIPKQIYLFSVNILQIKYSYSFVYNCIHTHTYYLSWDRVRRQVSPTGRRGGASVRRGNERNIHFLPMAAK